MRDTVEKRGRMSTGSRIAFGLAVTLTGVCTLAMTGGVPAWSAPARAKTPVPAAKLGTAVPHRDIAAAPADPAIGAAAARTAARARSAVHYPAGGSADVLLPAAGGAAVTPAGLPVRLGAVSRGSVPSRVRVVVADRTQTLAAGVDGLLVGLTGSADRPARTTLTLNYADLATAGGDFGARLRLVSLPGCALSTPALAACETRTAVPFQNDPATSTITAQVPVPAAQTVYAATSAPASGTGSYTATSLSSSSTWQSEGNSGDFTWSYPMRVPPAAGALEPDLGISYDSQSLDGRLPDSNNQASWVGDGFDLPTSYIERSYGSCADDGQAGKYDLCWKYDNATLVLDGQTTELIKDDSTGAWHPQDDDGSRITRTSSSGTSTNGDNDNETWTVTTLDGTKYVFGLNELPGWATGDAVTHSAWTAPVYGDDAGEPCHGSTFATSACTQAWRWNLDYVVDPNGNTETYWYTPETNTYAQDGATTVDGTSYIRGGYLSRIDYGQSSSAIYTSAAPDQVLFGTTERCLVVSGQTCTSLTSSDQKAWPDVPFDQICASGTHCTASQEAPTFFTTRRLTSVTTQYRTGSTYQKVDTWNLDQSFPATGDGTTAPLWLKSIQHVGDVGSTPITLNNVSFGGIQLTNRVDTSDDSVAALIRWRVHTITSETGSVITVNYMTPQCVGGTTMPTPDSNTTRCFPAYWTPPGAASPRQDWFQKYPVSQVLQSDPTTSSPTLETDYTYTGAAWHYDDSNGIGPAKDKTWSQWRGYATVETTQGSGGDAKTDTLTRYFQGMDGDKLAAGGTASVKVTDSQGTQVTDAEPLAGETREKITHNGVNGPEVSGDIYDKFQYRTAGQVQSWGTSTATIVRDAAVHSRTDLAAGGTRQQTVSTTYDTTTGLPLTVDDTGDPAVTGDERCTRTTYAQNTSLWLMDLVDRTEVVSVSCATAPDRPTDVISDNRTEYDGAAFAAVPGKGNATQEERLASYSGSTPVYQVTAQTTYDELGRPLVATDGMGVHTTTTYVPASGGPLTESSVTDALGGTVTTTVNPAWGNEAAEVDANGERTDLAYDALGRVTSAWLPTRSKSAGQNPNYQYAYTISSAAPSTVVTRTLSNDGSTYRTESIAFYDGLQRPRQEQTPAPGGGRVVAQTDYDTAGRTVTEDQDYTDATAPTTTMANVTSTWPKQIVTTYDGDSREVTDTLKADGAVSQSTSTGYGGDRTTVTPPAGGVATTTVDDIHGDVVERDQYNGSTPTGTHTTTKYTYTPAGDLATLTDSADNVWSYTYDLAGRQITAADPDAGRTLTDYDNDNRVTDTTDAGGDKLLYTYDALGRKTAEYTGTISAADEQSAWVYDTMAKGQLTSRTRYVGGAAGAAYTDAVTSYDAMYRPTGDTATIPSTEPTGIAGTYHSTTDYNLDGTTQAQTVPAGGGLGTESLTYSYGSDRELTGIQGTTGIVQNALYTKLGQIQQITLGTSATAKWAQITNQYRDGTEQLQNTLITDDTNTTPDVNTTYNYDPDGNVTEEDDQGGGTDDNQCFSYDGQARLSSAWTTTSTCAAGASTGLLGGPGSYWLSWTYDANTGLRTGQTSHTASATTTTSYAYSLTATGGPHALQSTTTGSNTATYAYNAKGETTSRPGATAQQSLTWTPEGDLATVTEGDKVTSDVYDADGDLLISHTPSGVTLYIDGEQITRSSTGTMSGQREIDFAGQPVAVRTDTGLSWLIDDLHNTATVAIDATTQAVTHRYETPFDTPRGTVAATWPDANGFLDKPTDPDTGLTYVGAREYDASIGRFLSVDPVLDDADPQSLAAYTYADNTPLVASDPTGDITEGGLPSGSSCNKACHREKNDIYRNQNRQAAEHAARVAAEERAAERYEEAEARERAEWYRYGMAHSAPRYNPVYCGYKAGQGGNSGQGYITGAANAVSNTQSSVDAGAEQVRAMSERAAGRAGKALMHKTLHLRLMRKLWRSQKVKDFNNYMKSDGWKNFGRGAQGFTFVVSGYFDFRHDAREHGWALAVPESILQSTNDFLFSVGGEVAGITVGVPVGEAIDPAGGGVGGGVAGTVLFVGIASMDSEHGDEEIDQLFSGHFWRNEH